MTMLSASINDLAVFAIENDGLKLTNTAVQGLEL